MEERVGILYFEASDAHTFETFSVSMSSHHPGCCQLTETTASRWCPQYILCACVCYGGDYVVHCCLRHDVHIWNTSKICLQSNFTANKKASFEEMPERMVLLMSSPDLLCSYGASFCRKLHLCQRCGRVVEVVSKCSVSFLDADRRSMQTVDRCNV